MRRIPPAARAGLVGFLASLGLYLATMAPDLPPGHDSAELVTAATVLGIPHPPGYPLYTLLGHLFTSAWGGNPAWAMNLFSVLSASVAVGLAGWAFSVASGSAPAGLAAALAFAVARTPWRMAVGAEVFSLHLALVAGLLAVAAAWRDAGLPARRRLVGLGGLLLGLGLAHHQTVVLVVPGLGAWWLLARGSRPGGWTWGAALAFLAGLSPLAWLPWRASQDPPLNWGDPDSPGRFLWVVARQGYGSLQLSRVSGTRPAQGYHLAAWAGSLVGVQFPVLGALVGVAGAAVGAVRRNPGVALFGSLWLLAGPCWALVGAQPEGEGFLDMMERFYAASDLGFAGLVALGLAAGLAAPGRLVRRATLGICVVLPLLGLGLNLQACSERGQYQVRDSLRAMTASLPPGALVVAGSDLTAGAFLFATRVEGRPMEVVPAGLVASDWFLAALPADRAEALRRGGLEGLLRHARERGVPVYLDFLPNGVDGFFVPEGLLYRYLAPGEPLPRREDAARRSLEILEGVSRRGNYRLSDERPFWTRHLVRTWIWAYETAAGGLEHADPVQAARAWGRVREMKGLEDGSGAPRRGP